VERENEGLLVRDGRDQAVEKLSYSGSLLLTGKGETENIQNEIEVEPAVATTVDPPVAGVVVERVETGESACREQGARAHKSVAFLSAIDRTLPGNVLQRLSREERERPRRALVRKRLQGRRRAAQKGLDVPLDEALDSIQWLLPNVVEFARKYLPRSP
jgi:hypothetical protein